MANGKEIGRVGQRRYGGNFYEEFLPRLRGKQGIQTYYEMSENDDVVGAILFAIGMLSLVDLQQKIKKRQSL